MLSNSDISPSTSINWWIVTILTFNFDLVHVPGTCKGNLTDLRRILHLSLAKGNPK
jgi:hypothetical protein